MVIDASAAATVCLSEDGFDLISQNLRAPILMRSEVLASIQGLQWRGEISEELATKAVDRLLDAPVALVRRTEILVEARRIALTLGWAKTYDAEYVALAALSDLPLLTIDARLSRRVQGIVQVLTPAEL